MTLGRRCARDLGPLGLYAVLSVLLLGIPVIGSLGSRIVASDPLDSSAFMWFLAWWPHALLHGQNPFVEHAMFVPEGFNLTWAAAMPGPAIVLSPITLAFGPAVTWNVIQLASPALSAWTMFLLCRHVTGRTAPSLVGGYVFGFAPYMLIQLTGDPALALVALLPVMVLLVLKRTRGSIGRRWFVIAMALALIGQYLISSEVLLTATLFGAVAYVLAYVLLAERRAALLDTAKLLALAYLITVVVISPFLYYFFFGHQYPPGRTQLNADLLSFVLPSSLTAIGHRSPPFLGSNNEGYVGIGLIGLVAVFLWQERRRRITWLLGLAVIVPAICALGAHLLLRGDETSIPLPWLLLAKLPGLRYAIPVRLALYMVLPVALIVAVFLSREARSRPAAVARWGLAALALVFIFPNVGNPGWNIPIQDPAFFASGEYRAYLKPSDHVLTIPAWGPNERWQADTGFRFKLADGYAGNPFPPSYTRYPIWNTLLTGQLTSDSPAQLRRFVDDKGVTAIVVDQTVPGPWRQLFGTLGTRPIFTGGVLLYRLRGTSSPAA